MSVRWLLPVSAYGTRFEVSLDASEDFGDVGRVSSYTGNTTTKIPKGAKDGEAHVGLAHIPSFCWPNGNPDDFDDLPTAPWLRLTVSGRDPNTDEYQHAGVCIDVQAARKLAEALMEWVIEDHADDL